MVKNDDLILAFGARLFAKLGPHKLGPQDHRQQHAHIREKMRVLGRLLLHLRKKDRRADLEPFMHPSKFPEVVNAVSEMTAGEDGECNKPNLVIKLCCILRDVANFVRTKAIMDKDEEKMAEAGEFILLYKRDWRLHVPSHARKRPHKRRLKQPESLPRNEDVQRITGNVDGDIADELHPHLTTPDELHPAVETAEDIMIEAGEDTTKSHVIAISAHVTVNTTAQTANACAAACRPAGEQVKRSEKVAQKRRWTQEEKDAVRKRMKKFLDSGTVPRKHECEELLREEPALSRRTWKEVKYCVYNMNPKKKRESNLR